MQKKGRILREYQLLYITKGKGTFASDDTPERNIEKGNLIVLFPDNGIRIARMYKPDGTNITSDSKEALSTSLLETDSCQKKIRYWI